MSLQPGTRLGNYEVLSELGRGGMGEVYKARDLKLGREVAIIGLAVKALTLNYLVTKVARHQLVKKSASPFPPFGTNEVDNPRFRHPPS